MDTLTVVSFEEKLCHDVEFIRALDRLEYEIEYVSGKEFLSRQHTLSVPNKRHLFLLNNNQINNERFREQFSYRLTASLESINYCLIPHNQEVIDCVFMDQFHELLFWPCGHHEFESRLRRFTNHEAESCSDTYSEQLVNKFSGLNLIGKSKYFLETMVLINKISDCDAPVLIEGETGTGKENAARAIHYLSQRADHGFVPINCGALPDELLESELFGHEKGAFTDAKQRQQGLVEIAKGGTLFLDEVDSLSAKAQAALLRFLQTQEYRPVGGKSVLHSDVRILSASNQDLTAAVVNKTFREDLLFRLNVLNVTMPPLRNRCDDIPRIAQSFLSRFAEQHHTPPRKLSSHSLRWLMQQPWPGNVRELENLLLREFLLTEGTVIHLGLPSTTVSEFEDIAEAVTDTPLSFQEAKLLAINQFEKEYLQALLYKAAGNVSEAARLAGKERRALGKLLKKYNIDRRQYIGHVRPFNNSL